MSQDYYEIAKKFPEFTKGDIDVFIEAFKMYDTDGSGAIDVKELEAALKAMGQGSSPAEAKRLLNMLDADKSGVLEFNEFLEMMKYFYPWKVREFQDNIVEPATHFPEFSNNEILGFLDIFRTFDKDESGAISIDELDEVFKYMGQGCSRERLQQIMKQYDVDKSGEIDWPEFLEIMRSFYPEKVAAYRRKYIYPAAKEFPEFSRKDIDAFVIAFKDFDLDGNGSIDANELGLAFERMGQGYHPDQLKKIIAEVDRDKNGTVEWIEFLAIMRKFYPQKRQDFEKKWYGPAEKFPQFSREDIDVFIQSFREYDLDGSGSIDDNELDLAFKSMGQGATPEKIKQIIKEVDANGNGVIEWEEYLQIMANIYSGRYSAASSSSSPSSPSPAKATTSVSQNQQASSFKAASTSSSSSPAKPGIGIGSRGSSAISAPGSKSCVECGKTVYPTEAIAAVGQTWHKGCFKCQDPSCSISLTLKTFVGSGEKVYCAQHVPKHKASVGADSMAISSAVSAPKVKAVSGVKKDARMTFAPGTLQPINPEEQEKENE